MDEAIRTVLAADTRIAYARLFGSAATNHGTPFSDVDIAIGLEEHTTLDRRAVGELITDLERATGRPVDLVLLDEAPPALAYRVFRDGRLVFEADHTALVRREAQAILAYLDFRPIEQICARAVLDAAAHG